jgi:NAD(P)-dependent dehydrogenase (short-subunit alcohol dehydrogenase family)
MKKHLTILTGASRGMGLAMAEQLCRPDQQLLCISRGQSDELTAIANQQGAHLVQWQADLAQPTGVAEKLSHWLDALNPEEFASATLINNAGAIGHLGPIDDAALDDLSMGLAINLQAPVLLSAVFLKHTRTWKMPRKILNISSGLGRRPMAASALYCAGKAGLDHFTRCLALDEALHSNPAKVVSLAPGVIDTDMQTELRSATGAGFPDQTRFVQMKNTGALTTPADAAAQILTYLQRPDFGSNPVADVRDI